MLSMSVNMLMSIHPSCRDAPSRGRTGEHGAPTPMAFGEPKGKRTLDAEVETGDKERVETDRDRPDLPEVSEAKSVFKRI